MRHSSLVRSCTVPLISTLGDISKKHVYSECAASVQDHPVKSASQGAHHSPHLVLAGWLSGPGAAPPCHGPHCRRPLSAAASWEAVGWARHPHPSPCPAWSAPLPYSDSSQHPRAPARPPEACDDIINGVDRPTWPHEIGACTRDCSMQELLLADLSCLIQLWSQ